MLFCSVACFSINASIRSLLILALLLGFWGPFRKFGAPFALEGAREPGVDTNSSSSFASPSKQLKQEPIAMYSASNEFDQGAGAGEMYKKMSMVFILLFLRSFK
jgi:hypothetical protein